tara:strand:- start:1348 stop:1695 length:348 start_codon:yes stop_codon:yes gene_type:complete
MTTKSQDPTQFDKLPLKSKKFLAYLIADIGWKILMFYVIWEYQTKIEHYAFMVLVTMIVTSGFIQIGYILGQAALDKYTHVAVAALDKDGDKPTPTKPSAKEEPDPNSTNPDEFM